ncbi:MAG: hypothetical protein ACFFAL_12255, partial [Promethearchaeota archaeon]
RVKMEVRGVSATATLGMDMYVVFLAAFSLLTPVLMRLILSSSIITLLLLAFLAFAENIPTWLGGLPYKLRIQPSRGEAHPFFVIGRPET